MGRDRIDLRLTPTAHIKLREIANARTIPASKADALRILIDEEHARIVAARGETTGNEPDVKREA